MDRWEEWFFRFAVVWFGLCCVFFALFIISAICA